MKPGSTLKQIQSEMSNMPGAGVAPLNQSALAPRLETRGSLGSVSAWHQEAAGSATSWLCDLGHAICSFDSTDRNPPQKNLNQKSNFMAHTLKKPRGRLCLGLSSVSSLFFPSSLSSLLFSSSSSFARGLPSRNWKGGLEMPQVLRDRLLLPLLKSHAIPCGRKVGKRISNPPGSHRGGRQFTRARGVQKTKRERIVHYGTTVSPPPKWTSVLSYKLDCECEG